MFFAAVLVALKPDVTDAVMNSARRRRDVRYSEAPARSLR
jgi:hypothetical protein